MGNIIFHPRTAKLALACLAALVFPGCKEDASAAKTRFPAPASFQQGIGKVYEGYLIVAEGMVAENATLALNALSGMHGRLHEIQAEALDSAAKAYWDSATGPIMTILHHPSLATGGLPEVRLAMMEFTPYLADRIERFGMVAGKPAFLFHCPKARDGRGADWLQGVGDGVANPYFGDSLRSCGSLVRPIQP